MIIDTNKKYKPNDIMDFMSDLVTSRLSDGYKIDFEQQFFIRNCSHIEDEIGETNMVITNHLESVLIYIVGDFDYCDQDICVMERHFEPGTIDDVTFTKVEEMTVAKFTPNQDGTYHLKGIRFNL